MLFNTLRTLTQFKGADSMLTLDRSCGHLPISFSRQLIRSHVLLSNGLKLLELD